MHINWIFSESFGVIRAFLGKFINDFGSVFEASLEKEYRSGAAPAATQALMNCQKIGAETR
jgi:hypothetical protein